jgi:hypothetical protein
MGQQLTKDGGLMRFLLILLAMSMLFNLAFAESIAKMDGCKLKMTIHVAYAGPGVSDAYMERAKNAVYKYWNNGHTFGECKCPFEVEVKTKNVSTCTNFDYETEPSYFCVTVHNTTGVHRANAYRSDFTRSLSSSVADTDSGPGQIEVHDSDATIAHEFGHFMGLHDEYVDHYQYHIWERLPNGTMKVVSGPHHVLPSEWTAAKQAEANRNLGPNQSIHFQRNPYGQWGWSRLKDGVENDSLMGVVNPNASVKQRHIDAIAAQCRFSCPERCCCGNGHLEANKGEECDPKASPIGCMLVGEYCTSNCICKTNQTETLMPPVCGDGILSEGEQCDYSAGTDCGPDRICSDSCTCESIEHPPMFTMEVLEPIAGAVLTHPGEVVLGFSDPGMIHHVEYYVDGNLMYEIEDPGFIWVLEPEIYGDGPHELEIFAYDLEGTPISEKVDFIVGMRPQ